jgi:RNA binding exosome subunit
MAGVYSGILEATLQNVNQLFTVINSFITQMSDAKRLELINQVASTVDTNYGDLLQFNHQNALLSLSRTKDQHDAAMVKWMYGLQP